ncbi:sugar phosphate isomerase/epimerase family protein [Halobellus litoreus]|uniref:Sugar phosphate isomerase/epimerase family protein n=1 Tax=Halobellus litoreus TaxID=755310 RepID=A0ABD6DYP6_9EURY|nr:sugar phosphate isomerase/epimerase [Halobellus litoreus]
MAQKTAADSEPTSRPRSAIQLHTLRDIDSPLPSTIRRVADAGFEGVEFAGRFLESNPHVVRESLDETGVTPVAAHVDLTRIESNVEALADRLRHVGCGHAIIPHLSGGYFRTKSDIDGLALRLENLADRLDSYGIQLSYHVSREPLLPRLDSFGLGPTVDLPTPDVVWRLLAEAIDLTIRGSARAVETTAFGRLVSQTDDLTFEVDVGWIAAARYDPVELFDYLDDRVALIHVADTRRTRRFPPLYRSVPPGDGILDLDRVLEASRRADVDWIVYEDDDPETPETAIRHGSSLFALDSVG